MALLHKGRIVAVVDAVTKIYDVEFADITKDNSPVVTKRVHHGRFEDLAVGDVVVISNPTLELYTVFKPEVFGTEQPNNTDEVISALFGSP